MSRIACQCRHLRWFQLHGWKCSYCARPFSGGSHSTPTVRAVYADCTFANLGGDEESDCDVCTSAINVNAVFVSIVNSTFFDPARFTKTAYIRAWEGGSVRISGCEFGDPVDVEDSLFFQNNGTFYSDDDVVSARAKEGPPQPTLPIAQAPVALVGSYDGFLQNTDPWFTSTVAVRTSASSHARPSLPRTCLCRFTIAGRVSQA